MSCDIGDDVCRDFIMDIIVFIGIKHYNVTSHLDIFQYQSLTIIHWDQKKHVQFTYK
jgi:hypothetical protein